jgi:hypothetical protein
MICNCPSVIFMCMSKGNWHMKTENLELMDINSGNFSFPMAKKTSYDTPRVGIALSFQPKCTTFTSIVSIFKGILPTGGPQSQQKHDTRITTRLRQCAKMYCNQCMVTPYVHTYLSVWAIFPTHAGSLHVLSSCRIRCSVKLSCWITAAADSKYRSPPPAMHA